jgi:hypothetical protein
MSDLPDYTRPIVVSVTVPPAQNFVNVEEKRPNRYVVFSIDLSTARPEPGTAVGLQAILTAAGVAYATNMTILSVPSAFLFKLNSSSNNEISASEGMELEGFELKEIYIVNTAVSGTAEIEVEYRVED